MSIYLKDIPNLLDLEVIKALRGKESIADAIKNNQKLIIKNEEAAYVIPLYLRIPQKVFIPDVIEKCPKDYVVYRGTRNETIELPPRQNFTDALWDGNDLIYEAPEGRTKFVFVD